MNSKSLQSRLRLTLLVVGLVPAVVVAVLLVVNTRQSLGDAASARVLAARDERAAAIETYMETVRGQMTTLAQDRAVVDALAALPAAFEAMSAERSLHAEAFADIEREVTDYYRGPFAAEYRRRSPGAEPFGASRPAGLDPAAIVAQHAYIAANRYPIGAKADLDDSGSNTTYDRLHASIHPGIRAFLREFGYYDIFLIDADSGRIVYSVFKETDFGTSLVNGPYAQSNLARAYRNAVELGAPAKVASVDYEPYAPSYDAPASFVASPVYDGRDLLGVLAFQLPLDRISEAVSRVSGLGESGDAFLVGPDHRMRSDSVRSQAHTTLASFRDGVTVDLEAVDRALAGETAMSEGVGLDGEPAVIAYTPVRFGGSNLALVASQHTAEAFGGVRTATWSAAGVVAVAGAMISFIAFRITRGMAENLNQIVATLVSQSRDVASGRLLTRNDPAQTPFIEFSPVLASANQMADAFTGQMNAVPVPIVVHDRDLRVQFANEAAAKLAKCSADDLLGEVFYERVGPEDWREASFTTRKTLHAGASMTDISRWQSPGGERDLRTVQTPIHGDDGGVVGVVETLLDETEIRAAQRRQKKVAEYQQQTAQELSAAFERVIGGDLTSAFEPTTPEDDELQDAASNFARIGEGFRRTLHEFRTSIAAARHNADETAAAAADLTELAVTLFKGTETTVDRASTVAVATEQMSNNVDSVASAAEEMSINIGSVAENATTMSAKMREVASAVERLSASIGEVAGTAESGSSVAADAAQKSHQANAAMETLGRGATEIDKVTEVIKRIAEKTNLLALNATIEAASAGEAGKGFAVVAHEVKELANQCATAAEDITERIAGVQRNTDEAVVVIGAMSETIGELARVSDGISARASEQRRAVLEILASVGNVDAGVERTASAITEIVQGATDVSRNAGELTHGATEIAASIGEVKGFAQTGGDAARKVGESASSLARVVDELRRGVHRFVIETDTGGRTPRGSTSKRDLKAA